MTEPTDVDRSTAAQMIAYAEGELGLRNAIAQVIADVRGAEAKLEKVATLLPDLDRSPGGRLFAQALDNVLFPCQCPGEHCGECGCCP